MRLFFCFLCCLIAIPALAGDLDGTWKVTKRVCAGGTPARDEFNVQKTSMIIRGKSVTFKVFFVAAGDAIPVDVHATLYDRAIVMISDNGAFGAAVINYEYDPDQDTMTLESKTEDQEDHSCPLGSKIFTTYHR
jgi:hypothetical protein